MSAVAQQLLASYEALTVVCRISKCLVFSHCDVVALSLSPQWVVVLGSPHCAAVMMYCLPAVKEKYLGNSLTLVPKWCSLLRTCAGQMSLSLCVMHNACLHFVIHSDSTYTHMQPHTCTFTLAQLILSSWLSVSLVVLQKRYPKAFGQRFLSSGGQHSVQAIQLALYQSATCTCLLCSTRLLLPTHLSYEQL